LGPGTKNPKASANRPICVKRETDCERNLDLLARSAGGEDCSHVILIHGVLTGQLAQHQQRRPQWLLEGCGLDGLGLEIG
jgi:hypothetical protein